MDLISTCNVGELCDLKSLNFSEPHDPHLKSEESSTDIRILADGTFKMSHGILTAVNKKPQGLLLGDLSGSPLFSVSTCYESAGQWGP